KPIDASKVAKGLRRVQGNGSYVASFETSPPGIVTALDTSSEQVPDTSVLVHLGGEQSDRPILMFGADLTAVASNVTRSSLDLRLVDRDLGGFNSELRADARNETAIGPEESIELLRNIPFVKAIVGGLNGCLS